MWLHPEVILGKKYTRQVKKNKTKQTSLPVSIAREHLQNQNKKKKMHFDLLWFWDCF